MKDDNKGVIESIVNDINTLLDKTDSVSELLSIWGEVDKAKKQFSEVDERIRTKIKTYLKERQWKRYVDKDSDISVTLSSQKREVIDKQQLKLMLSEAQMAQVIRISTNERMSIITPEMRRRLKNYVKRPKNLGKN